MKLMRLCALSLLVVVSSATAQTTAAPAASLDEMFTYLKTYDFGDSRQMLSDLSELIRTSGGDVAKRQDLVKRLAEITGGDATLEAKRYASRELAVIGTPDVVPAIAGLVKDPKTYDIGVKTLVTMPGPEAGKALETAATTLTGDIQHAAVLGLGRRGKTSALFTLGKLGANPEVAADAVRAIGDIGGMSALETLEEIRPGAPQSLYPAMRDAYLKVAEDLLRDGDTSTATEIYGELYKPEHPPHIRAAALGGLVAAEPSRALERVSNALTDDEPEVAHVALGYMRGIPGEAATQKFASLLSQADPQMSVLLLDALTSRKDAAARDGVMAAVQSEDEAVRLAAVKALGQLGDVSAVPVLLKFWAASAAENRRLVQTSLSTLPGDGVSEALLAAAQQPGDEGLGALRSLADRNALDLADELLAAGATQDDERRKEIARVLQALGNADQVPGLLAWVETGSDALRSEAARALGAVIQRTRPVEPALQPVVQSYEKAQDPKVQMALLDAIGNASGGQSLGILRDALKSPQAPVRSAAVKALSAWPDETPAADLLAVAESGATPEDKSEALTGYVKILRAHALAHPVEDLLAQYGKTLQLAASAQEKKQILGALSEVNAPGAFDLVSTVAADPELAAEATLATIKVAQALSGAYPEVALEHVEPVLAATKDQSLLEQAQAVKDAVAHFDGYITAWELAGPYKEEGKRATALFDMQFAPETDAASVQWRVMPMAVKKDKPYVLALDQVLGDSERVAYLRTQVSSPKAQEALLELGSNDGVKVWLNGAVIHGLNVGRTLTEGEDKVKLSLKEGVNDLMIAVYQQGGEWGAAARIRNADGSPIDGLTYQLPSQAEVEFDPRSVGTFSGTAVL